MTAIYPVYTSVYICDQDGVRLECLDYLTSYEYSKVANYASPCQMRLPPTFSRKLVKEDNIIEIWQGWGAATSKLDYLGFLRDWQFADDSGLSYTTLIAYSPIFLLSGRIVAANAGTAQASMNEKSDDMLKEIVKDHLGADAAAGRALTSVGGGFTVQPIFGLGDAFLKDFSRKEVYTVLMEICDWQLKNNRSLFFDIVPLINDSLLGKISFEFRASLDRLGNDRRWGSTNPCLIGDIWGNFVNGSLQNITSEEKTYAYVGGAGEGVNRDVRERSDVARLGASIWNRREGFEDRRGADPGDLTFLDAEGDAYLSKNKAYKKLTGDIVETEGFIYKKDWDLGDLVTVSYAGFQFDASVDMVNVAGNRNVGRSVKSRLEVITTADAGGGVLD